MSTIKVALPGYNALNDTNLDHFALYADDSGNDNVLIKEFTRGTVTLGAGGSQDITHNLGYIPFFMVFVNETSLGVNVWELVGIPVITGQYVTGASSSIVNIFNNSSNTRTFKYFIFYDKQVGGANIILNESQNFIKVAKKGFNAITERDPSNLIFHSDLNTFKIVHQEKIDLPIISGTSTYQWTHNSPLNKTTCMMIFAKFPDGKVVNITPLTAGISSFDENRSLNNLYFDNTNIYLNYGFVASNYTLHLTWLIFEASLQ